MTTETAEPRVLRFLTRRQRAVLACIERHVAERGYPPSIREIGDEVGLTSTSSVQYVIDRLVEAGEITRRSYRPRTLSVVASADSERLAVAWAAGRGESV